MTKLPPSPLKITTVKIEIDEPELKDVEIDGRTDIFSHPEVQRFTENHDGRVVQIKGDMEYRGARFQFQAGYYPQMGRIKIEKKGRTTGDTQITREAYEFLYDIYREFFIDV